MVTQERERRRGVLCMIIAGLTWGASGTISRFAPPQALAAPLTLAWVRVFLGGLMLCLGALAAGKRTAFLRQKEALAGGVCCALNQIGFFMSMDVVGVALGTMIVIGSSIVMAGIFGIFTGERPTLLWWTAALCGITGSCLAASAGSVTEFRLDGLLLGLLGGFGYACIGFCLRALGKKGFSPLESNGAALFFGSLLLLPLALRADLGWLLTPRGAVSALALGFIPTAVPYFFFVAALTRITVGQSYAVGLLEPLTAALLGIFLLGERIASTQALGMALELLCMVLAAWDATRNAVVRR